ncbi:MAG: YebC/PmpR family DNA-binding transcriptional regulator [Chloroflexi bacterium]|nr:MAG: YebC/PmpR family DNA-binding transcriptional regulator [Chloroflexota bacterium]
MSGHSKWSTIKRKKGAEDAKRGKLFTALAREITIAAREGGGDVESNPKLKLAVSKAKSNNMPKDNIERAIQRGIGGGNEAALEEITYEGYGVDGVAYMVDVLTDNKNRTLAEIKHVFSRAGGNLASAGSVAWQFDRKGYIMLKGNDLDYEEVFMVAAEAGADDVIDEDGTIVIYTPREMFGAVAQALSDAGYEIAESALRWEPQNETELPVESGLKNLRLTDALEALDDVQTVSSNLMMTDDVIAAFESE